MLDSVQQTEQFVKSLGYQETLFSWSQLEENLSLVAPGDSSGPPDFYLSLTGGTDSIPLTPIAASQFGRLSGVKPSIYKEFVRDTSLTARMVHYSMNKPGRGGHVFVCHTDSQVVNIFSSDKSFIGFQDVFDMLVSVPNTQFADCWFHPKGIFEVLVLQGDLTQSVTPGVFLSYNGRPTMTACALLHDKSVVLPCLRAPRKKKFKEGYEKSILDFVEYLSVDADNLVTQLMSLVHVPLADPVTLIRRQADLFGFSKQAYQTLSESVQKEASLQRLSGYDVVRSVAALAGQDGDIDRRFQFLAGFLMFHLNNICSVCGMPL